MTQQHFPRDGFGPPSERRLRNAKNALARTLDPPTVSSTKHHGLVPSDEFFRNCTVYSDRSIELQERFKKLVRVYATNHLLSEGTLSACRTDNSSACVSPIYTVFSCREGTIPATWILCRTPPESSLSTNCTSRRRFIVVAPSAIEISRTSPLIISSAG